MSHIHPGPLDSDREGVSETAPEQAGGTYTSAVQSTQPKGFFTPVNINRILLVLGFIGIFDASLLCAEVFYRLNLMCGVDGGCATVASHPSSHVFGIPVALIGLVGYAGLTIIAALRAIFGISKPGPLLYIGYAMAAFGAAASLYYQYTMFVVIQAFCPYCFASAINMILQLVCYALLTMKVQQLVATDEPRRTTDTSWVIVGGLGTVVAIMIGISALQSQKVVAPQVPHDAKISDLIATKDVHSFGDPKSPILVIEFADLLCIHCQEQTPKLHQFVDQHPGKIWTMYRHFPLMRPHPMAVTAALVSEYAAEKGKFWDYVQGIMAPMEEAKTPEAVLAPAKAIGLDVEDIKKRLNNQSDPLYDILQEDMRVASEFGINGTPTFFIEMPGQKVKVCTASEIFDVLSSSPYKEVLTRR